MTDPATFGGVAAAEGPAGASGAASGRDVTIGVAVAVPEPYAGQLQRWRWVFGDPLAEAIPAHVTLLPPTDVPRDALDDVRAHLGEVAGRETPFDLHLRGTGSFRPVSPVVFVQVAQGIGECERLERGVRSGLLARDLHFYYHPHVTVAHDVDDAALDRAFDTLAGYDARFTVNAFDLYEHGEDGVWRTVDRFAFDSVA